MTSESWSVAQRLAREVEHGRLQFDRAQADAAARLDGLARALERRGSALPFIGRLRAGIVKLARRVPAEPLRGLYLWGEVGRGKTHLMDMFYESLRFADRERTHFYRFMRSVHAQLRAIDGHADPLDAVADRLAGDFRVICLDEFFVADIADAMILAGLFRGLFGRGVVMVMTSNVAPRDLYKDGLQRQRFLPAIDLLEAHADVLHLNGGIDYRLQRLQRARTYFDARQPGTPEDLRRLWVTLAGERGAQATVAGPVELVIEGRPMVAQRVAAGMAWFEFDGLCSGPRSQNDYIELAHLFQTVFVSNVPRLGREREDEARRFVMLIDELYDRRVKLVISADAAVTELYGGERLQVEFARTASRLIEMQTERYLSGEHRP